MSHVSFEARLARLMIPVAVAVVAVFVTGQRAQSDRTRRVAQEAAEVWRLVDEGTAHSEGRTRATDEERRLWSDVARTFEGAVAPDVRLPFSREIASLATRTGVGEFHLVEVSPEDDGFAVDAGASPVAFDASGMEDGMEMVDAFEPAPIARVDVERHIYTVSFAAPFDGVVKFVDGLGRLSRLVEVESMSIEREMPGLGVEIRLATYGRAS